MVWSIARRAGCRRRRERHCTDHHATSTTNIRHRDVTPRSSSRWPPAPRARGQPAVRRPRRPTRDRRRPWPTSASPGPFAIQEMTLPIALAGNDLIGQARTGTGKTLGFGVPLLQRVIELARAAPAPPAGAGRRPDPRAVRPGRPRPRRRPARSRGVRVHRHLRRPGVRAAGRARCARASTSSSAPPAGCSTWSSRATCTSARSPPGAGRGRRDARPRLPARHRADPGRVAGPAADHAVLRDHARPDRGAGPPLHAPAGAHPGRGSHEESRRPDRPSSSSTGHTRWTRPRCWPGSCRPAAAG